MSEMEPFDKELRSLFEQETVQPGSDLDWGNMDNRQY